MRQRKQARDYQSKTGSNTTLGPGRNRHGDMTRETEGITKHNDETRTDMNRPGIKNYKH